MKKIAVLLSGCGFLDGSEIYETVTTFIALEAAGVSYQCVAPNISQTRVMNYITKESMSEKRNVLIESARLARGNCQDLATVNADDYDALILPGGFGAASTLSNFAEKGSDCVIEPQVKTFIEAFKNAHKPVGFICIAPSIAAKIYGQSLRCTIGHDASTAQKLAAMGARHEACNADEIVIDPLNKVVTTPAYMVGQSITEISKGISKLVYAIVSMI